MTATSGKGSQRKGKRFEQDVARILTELTGREVRRGQVFNGEPDIVGVPGIHVECKNVERLNIHAAFRQSVGDARPGEIPIVVHHIKNERRPVVTLWLEDLKEAGKRL